MDHNRPYPVRDPLPLLPLPFYPQREDLSPEQRSVLEVMRRTFSTYITEDQAAVDLKAKLNEAEAALAAARNKMKLGYTDPKTGGCSHCQQGVHVLQNSPAGRGSTQFCCKRIFIARWQRSKVVSG